MPAALWKAGYDMDAVLPDSGVEKILGLREEWMDPPFFDVPDKANP